MKVKVSVKSVGRLRGSVEQAEFELENEPRDVRELILETVSTCVSQFEQRANREVLSAVTREKTEDMAQTGKISFGAVYGERKVDIDKAKENALISFDDGIYRIFLGERELCSLDEEIKLDENSVLTFVRLTQLAGRLW